MEFSSLEKGALFEAAGSRLGGLATLTERTDPNNDQAARPARVGYLSVALATTRHHGQIEYSQLKFSSPTPRGRTKRSK